MSRVSPDAVGRGWDGNSARSLAGVKVESSCEGLIYQGWGGFDGYEKIWESRAAWMALNGLSRSILSAVMNLSLINTS